MGGRTPGSPNASPRQPRAYSPFNRSVGLRRLPDDRLALSIVCSLIFHAMIVILMLRVADLPAGSGSAVISSVASWVDLTAPEPARGTAGAASTAAASRTRRSGSPALPTLRRSASTVTPADPSRAAITAATRPQVSTSPPPSSPVSSKAAQDQPALAAPDVGAQNSVAGLPSIPEGDEPLGSPQPGTASEVVAFGREGPVVTAAIMPQPAKTLTTIATIDGLPLDRGAVLTPVSRRSQALPSLEPTPKVESRPVANPQPDETWPEAAPALAAEPKIHATAVGSPVPAALSSLSAEPSRDAPLPQQSMTSSAASVSARAMTSAAEASPVASPRVEAGEPNRPRIRPVAGDPRRTGSAVGAPSGRAKIRFDGPRARVTQKDVETVTGKIAGGTMGRVLVYVNEIPMELAIGAGSFQASVPLQPGLNQLRAVATGPGRARDGRQYRDRVRPAGLFQRCCSDQPGGWIHRHPRGPSRRGGGRQCRRQERHHGMARGE